MCQVNDLMYGRLVLVPSHGGSEVSTQKNFLGHDCEIELKSMQEFVFEFHNVLLLVSVIGNVDQPVDLNRGHFLFYHQLIREMSKKKKDLPLILRQLGEP